MPKIRSCLRLRAHGVLWRALAAWSLMLLAIGCNERDRLTFPSPGDGVGPVTTIDRPNGADTTISPGGDFFVDGRTTDPDGVDSVYILVTGGSQNFSPVHPNPARTTVSFAIPLATSGHAGETILVQIYGVDVLGNQGGTSTRQINIR